MADRYYRRKEKNNDSIDDLTNIILNLQQKMKNTINLKNIFRYNLKDNIYIRFR